MGSFLAFQSQKDRELTPERLRDSFIACGVPCVLESGNGSAPTISFEPTANVLFLEIADGRVANVELASDGRNRSRLPNEIIDVLHRSGYEYSEREVDR